MLSAKVNISKEEGNGLSLRQDGLYVNAEGSEVYAENASINVVGGNTVGVSISEEPDNALSLEPDGLFAAGGSGGEGCCCWPQALIAYVPNEGPEVASDIIYLRRAAGWDPYVWSTNTPYGGGAYATIPIPSPATAGFPYDMSSAFSPDATRFYTFNHGADYISGTLNSANTSDISAPTYIGAVGVDNGPLLGLANIWGPSLAIDPSDGTLYFLYYNGTTSILCTLDPITGIPTVIGNTGLGAGSAVPYLWFDITGQLWLGQSATQYRVTKSTAAISGAIWTTSNPCSWYSGFDGVDGYAFLQSGLDHLKYTNSGLLFDSCAATDSGMIYAGAIGAALSILFTRLFCSDSEGVITYTDRDPFTGEELPAWPEGTTFGLA